MSEQNEILGIGDELGNHWRVLYSRPHQWRCSANKPYSTVRRACCLCPDVPVEECRYWIEYGCSGGEVISTEVSAAEAEAVEPR